MKLPVFTVERLSARMEIRTAGTVHECYVRDRFWRKEEGREPYVGPAERKEVQA